MSIQLYRQGKSHVFKGVECEVRAFEEMGVAGALKDGWHMNIDDIDSEKVDECTISPPIPPAPKRGKARREK